jgi:sulfur relay (sulfurtransferase) DsrF/TusC family protein
MSRYFFIQSQDPFTEVRTHAQYDLAKSLAANGNAVSVLLVQNGVLAARTGARSEQFDSLSTSQGVTILADTFSLRQREITNAQLKSSVQPAEINVVVDALLNGDKVIWN